MFSMPLTMAPLGRKMMVHRITGKDETRRFLANLGFVEGADIYVVSELNGNVIICVKDTRVALDKSLTNRIMVSEIENQKEGCVEWA